MESCAYATLLLQIVESVTPQLWGRSDDSGNPEIRGTASPDSGWLPNLVAMTLPGPGSTGEASEKTPEAGGGE